MGEGFISRGGSTYDISSFRESLGYHNYGDPGASSATGEVNGYWRPVPKASPTGASTSDGMNCRITRRERCHRRGGDGGPAGRSARGLQDDLNPRGANQ